MNFPNHQAPEESPTRCMLRCHLVKTGQGSEKENDPTDKDSTHLIVKNDNHFKEIRIRNAYLIFGAG